MREQSETVLIVIGVRAVYKYIDKPTFCRVCMIGDCNIGLIITYLCESNFKVQTCAQCVYILCMAII